LLDSLLQEVKFAKCHTEENGKQKVKG